MTYIRLDKLRAVYKPQIPSILEHPTQLQPYSESPLALHQSIATLFPYTAQLPILSVVAQEETTVVRKPLTVAVLLSGDRLREDIT